MAAGTSTAEGGDGERGVGGDAEMRGLEEEMLEAQSTLVGEMQQIESLAREKSKKVHCAVLCCAVLYCTVLKCSTHCVLYHVLCTAYRNVSMFCTALCSAVLCSTVHGCPVLSFSRL